MKPCLRPLAVALPLLLFPFFTTAHEGEAPVGKLGTVAFANSCSEKVKNEFEQGVAMLHSFWYNLAEKTFDDILKKDPQCAIAAWGLASILMNNPLAGQGATKDQAAKASAALEKAKQVRAGTQRERDYIDAASAYYANFADVGERARMAARAEAYAKLAQRYPSDDEAQIFYALYNAGTQAQSDQTYAAYLKSAAILEGQFSVETRNP